MDKEPEQGASVAAILATARTGAGLSERLLGTKALASAGP